jgi:hypothetical protein
MARATPSRSSDSPRDAVALLKQDYPAAKQAFEDEEETEIVSEAEVEHGSVKELIGKLEGMTPEDEHFEAVVKVLSEYVKHHVKEEEGQLFPKLKKTDADLKELGSQLENRKIELMEQMGIAAQPQELEPSRRRGAPSRATPSSKRASSGERATRAGARRSASSSRSRGAHARSTRH